MPSLAGSPSCSALRGSSGAAHSLCVHNRLNSQACRRLQHPVARQRRVLTVHASALETPRLGQLAQRFSKGFASEKKSTSSRDLEVDIVLQNPDKALAFNQGDLFLIDENGKKSEVERFSKVTTSLKAKGGLTGLFNRVTGGEADSDNLEYSVLKLDHAVPEGFGKTAALQIRASSSQEDVRFWLLKVTVREQGSDINDIALAQSWVHCKQDWRVFWINRTCYLPSNTPPALKELRENELQVLRTDDGKERRPYDRIYNYAVYNDLGTKEKPRPTLDPYPRREATNRPLNSDGSEGASGLAAKASWMPQIPMPKIPGLPKQSPAFFIPFDEEFSPSKATTFKLNGLLYAIPSIVDKLLDMLRTGDKRDGWDSFLDIFRVYEAQFWDRLTAWLPESLKFLAPTPGVVDGRINEWETDEEVGRQTLAGQNPCMLQALTGIPQGCTITSEQLQPWVEGNNLQELFASGNRLFQVDYTVLKSFLAQANSAKDEQGNTPFYMYATRGIFYRTNAGYMTIIAIEMIDCPDSSKPDSLVTKVVLPRGSISGGSNVMDKHYWRLAKAYFASNDSGYHQLVSHWLRTHACTEPYIIATRRQLSAVHPVYELMHPHFKYTMPINRNARQRLINAGGVIESSFSPSDYCLRVSAAVYGAMWQFDKEALPADLIHRGMAREDPNGSIAWKGKRYSGALSDYPYAEDGMDIWNAVHRFCSAYLKVYYPDDQAIQDDTELNAWWSEIQEKGHPDIKTGWPALKTIDDLANILSTMIWIVSGHHAAVNFAQYTYSGYMPNHPSATHQPMPDPQDVKAWEAFKESPDRVFLDTTSNKKISLKVMLIVQLLSTHDPDEEYLGFRTEGWTANPGALKAHAEFVADIKALDAKVEKRNANPELKSRFPDYTTLQPHTTQDDIANVVARGVPNSISI